MKVKMIGYVILVIVFCIIEKTYAGPGDNREDYNGNDDLGNYREWYYSEEQQQARKEQEEKEKQRRANEARKYCKK